MQFMLTLAAAACEPERDCDTRKTPAPTAMITVTTMPISINGEKPLRRRGGVRLGPVGNFGRVKVCIRNSLPFEYLKFLSGTCSVDVLRPRSLIILSVNRMTSIADGRIL